MRPLHGDEPLPRDSEYLGADDLDTNTEPVLTIKNLYRGKVTLSRGKETKNVIVFAEEKADGIIGDVRPMIVNSTNRQTLKKLYGQVTASALEGKKIQLYIEHGVRNPSNGELTDGIRIRDKKPAGTTAAKVTTYKCDDCGKAIAGVSGFTAEQIARNTKSKYGRCLCVECGQKEKAKLEAAVAEKEKEDVPEEAPMDDIAAQLLEDAKE